MVMSWCMSWYVMGKNIHLYIRYGLYYCSGFMDKRKISMDLNEDYITQARVFGAKNKIKGGLTGVVRLALEELIPTIVSPGDVSGSEVGPGIIKKHKDKEGWE